MDVTLPPTLTCTHTGCGESVPAEIMHLGTGLCPTHQDSFDRNLEVIFPGRNRRFRAPSDLWSRAVAYLEARKTAKEPLTGAGLALSLGVTWPTLERYRKGLYGPGFAEVMDLLSHEIEAYAETGLYGDHSIGAWRHLMGRFGWSERSETNLQNNGGGFAAPVIYLPHNGRDPVDTVTDPSQDLGPVVGGDPSTKSSDRQSPTVGALPG